MLLEQNKALEELCIELNIPDINEFKRVLIDNSDIKMTASQWPSAKQDFYLEIKQYICKEKDLI